ncbi:hypothetical protein C2S52_005947 [Perilla frutescens var. hirtella]|uniref:AT hook motif-containing protein n=1 Tax=Perilla frutescens var. hirtella TaxID=608512 RepID=A0AAD4P1K4_PERFH|nr:hypothetical protein C2S51_009811 [Perilla frutescens var. frutescens]KAH6786395.1 hypothetical protein C2S52_005947 [Perilla frutescens var. hirtella]KAH6822791.1 hypothetical protein C2S53_017087 [Perilla frutescens var. hirtella]
MNMLDEGENSGMSIQPAKRRRGRPRKDANLKVAEAAPTAGSEGGTAYLSQRANRTKGTECMVGQAVTGFIEATFDSGYLLTVRIGNSNTNLRGVVFKPGHCVPITAENDIAPHAQMIRRSDVRFPVNNQGRSPGPGVHMQTAAVVPSKRKHAPVPQVSTVASVARHQQTSDIDVHVVEPLSMLPPGRALPVGQVFVAAQPYPNCQLGSEQYDDGSFNKDNSEVGQDENHNPKTTTGIDTQKTSQASDTVTEDAAEESLKSSPENSNVVSEDETGNTYEPFPTESSHIEPLFNYGTGRMTELLKALQENSKERQMRFAEQPPSEIHETSTRDSVPEKQGSIP